MAVSVAMNYNSLTISVALILDKKDHVYVKNIWSKSSGIVRNHFKSSVNKKDMCMI
jgi:hypothetical protein